MVASSLAVRAPRAKSLKNFREVSRESLPTAKLATTSATSIRRSLAPSRATVHNSEAEKLPVADRVGIWLSFICVIHCLLTPVLLLVFPALEAMQVTKLHEGFHLVLLLVLPIVAVIAFIPGYRKHGSRAVFYWAFPGLVLIAYVAVFFEEASWLATAVSVSGSLLLIRAHSINRRLCACCRVQSARASIA